MAHAKLEEQIALADELAASGDHLGATMAITTGLTAFVNSLAADVRELRSQLNSLDGAYRAHLGAMHQLRKS